MGSEEVFVCKKIGNERHCFKGVLKHDEAKYIQDLTEEEAKIAETAKQGAIEVLQDALKKKEKVLMKEPEEIVLKGEEKEPFWMKRHAILTEDRVKELLEELKKVIFKKNINKPKLYAFVKRRDKTRTVYLCSLFWNAPKHLEKNSQPGTLIHEVSHFLGARDIAYGWMAKPVRLGCKGVMVKNNLKPSHSSDVSSPEEKYKEVLQKALWNADNVEYEFELTLNHKGNYVGGKYSCCGETARYSVCDQSVPNYFHTCIVGEKWETEKLVKGLCRRSDKIKCKLRQHYRTTDEMDASLRKARTSRKACLSMDFAGGAALPGGLLLASLVLVLSALVAGWSGVAVAGAALLSMRNLKARTSTKKEELIDIFAECQSFLDDVRRVIVTLYHESVFQRDFGIKCFSCSYLEYITVSISQIMEEVESESDDVQKMHRYMEGTIQCAHLLDSLCKFLFE